MKWPEVALADVLHLSIGGVWGKEPGAEDTEVRVWRVTELKAHGRLDPSSAAHRSVPRRQYESRSLQPGDLLLEKSGGGPKTPVGRVGLVRSVSEPAVCANFMQLMRPRTDLIEPRFLHLYLNHFHQIGGTTEMQTASTNIRNIKASAYVQLHVPLPSRAEQCRIVDLLEDHLSRLDAAEAYLDAGRRRLDSLVQIALSNCRDGDLQRLGDVTTIQGGIQKQPKRAPKDNAFSFLRVANVTARGLDLDDVHQIELFDRELDRLRLQVGDLLVVEGNGSASQIGRAALWDGSIEDCVHQNHLIRVRPLDGLLSTYLEAVWNSPQNRATLTDVSSSSSGLHTLSVSKLKALAIPVPTVERQRELVAHVEEVRGATARLAHAVTNATSRKGALRRAILAAAFSGSLTGAGSDLSESQEMIGA